VTQGRDEFDRGWEGHDRRQARLGLELSPAERLEWLERTLAEMREILGRAAGKSSAPPADPGPSPR